MLHMNMGAGNISSSVKLYYYLHTDVVALKGQVPSVYVGDDPFPDCSFPI